MLGDAAASYDKSANIWNSLKEWRRAANTISQGLRCALEKGDVKRARSILAEALPDGQHGKCGKFYLQTLQQLIKQSDPFAGFIYRFSSYCKRHYDPVEKAYYKSGLNAIVDALTCAPPSYLLNALAAGVEQAREDVLSESDLEMLAESIGRTVDHLHYRSLPDGMKVWTLGLTWELPIVIQVRCLDESPTGRRVAMAVAIILLANSDRIEKEVIERGGNCIDGFSFEVMMERTAREASGGEDLSLPSTEEYPASFVGVGTRDNLEPSIFVMLHDSYEPAADWAQNPETKAFVWVLMNVYRLLVAHCTQRPRKDDPDLARAAREFCEDVLS